MLDRRTFLLGGGAALLAPRIAAAQCAPIDLGIVNLKQETPVWCWVAVAQQIILWKTGNQIPQCALAGMASSVPPAMCCGGHPACVHPAGLQQIQALIANFGFSLSHISPPAAPQAVYQTLAIGKAIIMAVQSSPVMSHVVVIRGMACHGPVPILYVNDPASNMTNPLPAFSGPVPFQQLAQYWQAAIVVW